MPRNASDGPVASPLTAKSLPAAFLAKAEKHPDQTALREYGSPTVVSLGEWAARARAVAGGLAGLGLRRGERVGLMLTNRLEFHIVDMGALLLGAVPFSLYLTASPNQLSEIVTNAQPRVLVAEASSLSSARALRARHPDIRHLVLIDPADLGDGELSLAELADSCPDTFDAGASADGAASTDICTLVYTSGTTGPPKGVPFQHGAMLACLESIRRRFPVSEADRAISYLPMAHIAERLFGHYAAVSYGYEVTSLPDMSELTSALRDVRPTRFFGVPRIYEKVLGGLHAAIAVSSDRDRLRAELDSRLVAVRDGDRGLPESALFRELVGSTGLAEARFLAVAGAPSSRDMLEELTAFGFPINEFYGTSEVIVIAANPPDRIRLGTVGTALPGASIQLAEDGEILVSGPTVMPGYFHDPRRSADALDAHGWFHTGDLGVLDEEGYLRIVDRKKALIINSAGKNMSPATIEQAIKGGQPLISQVFAVGDGRPYNVALIVLDREGLTSFATEHRLGQGAFAELSRNPRVLEAVTNTVVTGNQRLSRVEQIKRFRVLDHDWPLGSSFLTPTAKLRRAEIQAGALPGPDRGAVRVTDDFTTEHITGTDDLRHRMPEGGKTRDSLFWNLVLPDEQIAVQLYVWTDGRGVAGRQVSIYVPDRSRNIIRNAFNVDLGPDSDLDDWECEGLRLRQPEPLRTAELTYDSEDVSLEYAFAARHRPFSYRANPAGCPHWMATNRYEQSGRASGILRVHGREIPFAGVWAHRDHSWGRRNWNWVHHWKWLVAGTPSGTELNAMFHIARGELGVNGHVLRDGEPVALVDGRAHASYYDDMSQSRLEADLIDALGGKTHLEMERFALFQLPFGSDTLLSEAACRVRINGEEGTGQFETLWPRSYVKRLVDAE